MASKGAVVAFTEAMAKELKDFNIQVNAIAPGAVNTRLLEQALSAGALAGEEFSETCRRQKKDGGTPPEKAAELAIFLAGKESGNISGKVLSAVWDDYKNFPKIRAELGAGSLYTLRRIDNSLFSESKKKS